MKRILIALAACSIALASCGPLKTGIDPVTAAAEVQKFEDRYLAAKGIAEILMPYLSPRTQDRIRGAERVIEQALVAARIATTEAERRAALKRIEEQTAVIETAAPLSPD